MMSISVASVLDDDDVVGGVASPSSRRDMPVWVVGINHAMVWLWRVRVVFVSRTSRVCAGGVCVRVC